jgi:hypothetical protein
MGLSPFRRRSKGALVVAGVLAAGVLTTVGAAQAGVAKWGPDAAPVSAGVQVADNTASAKPGVALAARASLSAAKALSPEVTPALNGYGVVSAEYVNPAGAQSLGTVLCPTGKVAFGGGVLGNSFGVQQSVNSSYPMVSSGVAKGWGAFVDNAGITDETFIVYAVCAKKPANYAIVSAALDNPIGTQTTGSVACPIGSTGVQMKPFAGGAIGSSTGLLQNINTSIPVKSARSWRVDMNNASALDQSVSVYVVCGLKSGWKVFTGAAVTNGPNIQTAARAACGTGLTSVGGGLFSSSGSTSVDLNGTYPDTGTSWLSFENNPTATTPTITPYVVCLS